MKKTTLILMILLMAAGAMAQTPPPRHIRAKDMEREFFLSQGVVLPETIHSIYRPVTYDTLPARLLVSRVTGDTKRQEMLVLEGYYVTASNLSIYSAPKAFLDEKKKDIAGEYYLWDWRRYENECGCEDKFHREDE